MNNNQDKTDLNQALLEKDLDQAWEKELKQGTNHGLKELHALDEKVSEHGELTRIIEEPAVAKMGIAARIIGIFVSPGSVLQNIKVYPVFWVPLIVTILMGLASIPFTSQLTDMTSREFSNISIELYGVDLMNTGAAIDEYGDIVDTAANTAMTVGVVASVVVSPIFGALLSALWIWLLTKITRGSATLGQYFSMYTHIYVVAFLGSFIISGLMIMTDRLLDVTSLAAILMPTGNISMVSFNVLSTINIFNVWGIVLTFMGLKILNDFSNVKAGIISGIVFATTIGISVATYAFTFILWDMAMGAM